MSEERLSLDTADKRRTLWIVLALWAVLTVGFAIRHFSLALGGY